LIAIPDQIQKEKEPKIIIVIIRMITTINYALTSIF